MRLISLIIRNYRVHRELTIGFDPARNIIGGPNESGKSTLAEAIHRALFLRAKTGGNLREEMRSSIHSGEPEVILTFEAGGTRWIIEKRFAGTRGSALLKDGAGQVYRDDEAESKLSEIHLCETNGGRVTANQLPSFWSHLWVWQGTSGNDPSSHASDHKDTLVQRLQQDGLAAVMQSSTDQRVRERITAAYEELFTQRGPKAGSKPELARQQLTEAETALTRALEIAERLEQAAAEHQRAERELGEVEAVLPGLLQQKSALEEKLREVEKLSRQNETHHHQWASTDAHLKLLKEHDATIRRIQEQADAARAALDPADRLEGNLLAEEKRATELNRDAEAGLRGASESIRISRLRHDHAAAAIAAFEKAADHERISARHAEAAALQAEIASHQATITPLPDLSAKDLDSLRQSERVISQTAASLAAMATSIELLSADQEITLDGRPLAQGEIQTLADEGELRVGAQTRMRIRPGGGASLAEMRSRHEQAQQDFTAALDRHTLRDLDHATAVFQQRQTLSQQIEQLRARWKALGGESLSSELAAAATAYEAAKAEAKRRLAALESPPALASTLEEAQRLQITCRRELELAEEAEGQARHKALQQRERLDEATTRLHEHRARTSDARQSLRDLETRIQVLQESHGDTAKRQSAITQATTAEQEAASQLARTRTSLAALAPELLTADTARLKRAIEQQDERRREAENLKLIARERLALDGSSDPHAELAQAQARHAMATELHATERRRAEAIKLLYQRFSSAREAIDRAIVQPLADRISGYLRCLFGMDTELQIRLSDKGIEGFELMRSGDRRFDFQTLSGGAREQVAAGVRLAMAEILAANHEGCLPMIFDDAFAYSDAERIQSLQRMLDLAASRGLQILVLTCTPADYSAFGAFEVRLS